ncbi:hypothetical protein [Actinopolymorpha alba]|uniref:hypothetical protein n=1 Tax=Actinopolymorpha alba TaxID=533267 RepID=UPI0004781A68|nr:hypothetical protein [Actinopolymorpha alba]
MTAPPFGEPPTAAPRTAYATDVGADDEPLVLKLGPGDDPPAAGYACYDQVVATVPVREVPFNWVRLVRPGGELTVSWLNPFAGPVLARLTVTSDGRASGHFLGMVEDANGDEAELPEVVVEAESSVPWYRMTTSIDPDSIWSDPAALFALGVRLPRLRWTQTGDGTVSELGEPLGQVRRWVYDSGSCACAVRLPSGEAQVEQHGPRLLWREVESAYRWWVDHDRPSCERFGLSVTSFGQFAWLGHRCSGRIWRL